MSANGGYGGSAITNYETPPYFVDRVKAYMGLELTWDCASSKSNYLGPDRITRFGVDHDYPMYQDGLDPSAWSGLPLDGFAWCNPPYGRNENKEWSALFRQVQPALKVPLVLLIPVARSSDWWHRNILPVASEILDVHGRIQFWLDGAPLSGQSSSFDNVLVVVRPGQVPASPRHGVISGKALAND